MSVFNISGNTNGTITLNPAHIVSVGTVTDRIEHGTQYWTYGIELPSGRIVHPRFATSGGADTSRATVIGEMNNELST
jgi:hypothetical protein